MREPRINNTHHEPSGDSAASSTEPTPSSAPAPLEVAYHAGPEHVHFNGRLWYREQLQPVTAEEWAAMQARGDFTNFDFKSK